MALPHCWPRHNVDDNDDVLCCSGCTAVADAEAEDGSPSTLPVITLIMIIVCLGGTYMEYEV